MVKGFYNLTSGMLTQGRRLNVIANNMGNIATAGFKTDRYASSTFQEAMWRRTGNKEKTYTDLGTQSFITAPSQLYTDYEQGSFDETGFTLDFAIDGKGWFAISTPDGVAYTRNGNFSLDDDGYLYLPGEGRVLDPTGNTIRLLTDKVEADNTGGLYTVGGEVFLYRIGVFTFQDDTTLEKNGRSLFTATAPASVASDVVVHQGMVERSNVDLVEQMTGMIAAQRAYQGMATVTKIYDNLIQKATDQVGRHV